MITFVFPSDVSSWSTRDMGIADGLLKVKQIVKLSPETGFGWQQTPFLFFLGKNPFLCDFLTYLGFSISSLILNTMLTSGPVDPFRKSHFLFGVYCFHVNQSKKIELIDHYGDHTADKESTQYIGSSLAKVESTSNVDNPCVSSFQPGSEPAKQFVM